MYHTTFGYRHSGADASGAVFALKVDAAELQQVNIHRVEGFLVFDGTGASSSIGYGFSRFTCSTNKPTGGTSPGRLKSHPSNDDSILADADIKQGAILTITAVSWDHASSNLYEVWATAKVAGTNVPFLWVPPRPIVILPNSGFACRLAAAAIINQAIYGTVHWSETPLGM